MAAALNLLFMAARSGWSKPFGSDPFFEFACTVTTHKSASR